MGSRRKITTGLLDDLSLTEPRAVRIGTIHLALNLTIAGLFVANLVMRTLGSPPAEMPFPPSIVAVALLLVSGWFGWELIYRQGVAISPEIEIRAREHRGAA